MSKLYFIFASSLLINFLIVGCTTQEGVDNASLKRSDSVLNIQPPKDNGTASGIESEKVVKNFLVWYNVNFEKIRSIQNGESN